MTAISSTVNMNQTSKWRGNVTLLFQNISNNTLLSGEFKPYNLTTIKPARTVSILSPILMSLAGISGNILALSVLCRCNKYKPRSAFYKLVAGLAATDLLGQMSVSPVVIAMYKNNLTWIGGQPLCDYFSFMMIFSGLATTLIVGAMAIERYIAIRYPLYHTAKVTNSFVKIAFCTTWGFAIIYSTLPIFGIGENVIQFPRTWCFFNFQSEKPIHRIYAYVYAGIVMLCITVVVFCNLSVIVKIIHMSVRHRRLIEQGRVVRSKTNHRLLQVQTLVLLAGIMLVFVSCWMPLMLWIVLVQSGTVDPRKHAVSGLVVIRLAALNQVLDPWIYILFRKEFFEQIYHFMQWILGKQPSPTRPRRPSTTASLDRKIFEHVRDCDVKNKNRLCSSCCEVTGQTNRKLSYSSQRATECSIYRSGSLSSPVMHDVNGKPLALHLKGILEADREEPI